MYQSRTFSRLLGIGILLALLLMASALRTILAGSPGGWHEFDLACLLLPTNGDLGIHLLGYALIATIIAGISYCLALGYHQWTKTRSLTKHLARLKSADSRLRPLIQQLGLTDRVQLLDSDTPLCLCTGFLSPRIYLSRSTADKLTPEESEALLLHEKYHLDNRDPLKVLIGRLVVSALFFIPALKDMFQRYLIEKEIAADRSAIECQGHRRGLAGALHKLAEEHLATSVGRVAVGGGEALVPRIDHLMGRPPQQVYRIPLPRFVISLLLTAFIIATTIASLPGSHPVSSAAGSTLIGC